MQGRSASTQKRQWWASKELYLAVCLQALHMLMGFLHANAVQSLQEVTAGKDAHLQHPDSVQTR